MRNKKYLVVVADDMGRSPSVNQAVAEAHDKGIVTAASIMAGGGAFGEAVRIARERRGLSIGIHATLCDGKAVLPHAEIPGLTGHGGYFAQSPSAAGVRYARSGLLPQIEAELNAQFERIERAGMHPTHVDGHHHLHMHPILFSTLCRLARQRGAGWIRLPGESFSLVYRLRSSSRGAMPLVEWAIFGMLGRHNIKTAKAFGLRTASRSYGLSRTGNVDEDYLLALLGRIDGLFNELFVHPDYDSECGRKELKALTSPGVRERIAGLGITLAGYRELSSITERESE